MNAINSWVRYEITVPMELHRQLADIAEPNVLLTDEVLLRMLELALSDPDITEKVLRQEPTFMRYEKDHSWR